MTPKRLAYRCSHCNRVFVGVRTCTDFHHEFSWHDLRYLGVPRVKRTKNNLLELSPHCPYCGSVEVSPG